MSAVHPAVSGVDVFLSGLAFYDVVFTGLESSPTPGTEIWAGGLGSGPGGIANFAVTLRRLGLTASLAAAFGDDPHGELCRRELAAEGVDLSGSRWFPGWRTPVTVALAYAGDRALVTHGAPPPVGVDDLVGDLPAVRHSRAAIVHLGLEPVRWIGTAAAAGSLVFADVGWDPSEEWPGDLLDRLALCHAFMPNADEAMAYTRTGDPRAALSRLADVVPLAVVTLGRDGAIAVDATTGESAAVPAVPVDVVDTTGAGDVFGACLVAATLAGLPLVERLRFAALGAGLSLRRPGGAAAAPSWPDIAAWWDATRARPSGDALRRDYGFLDDVLPRGNSGHPDPVLTGDQAHNH